MRPINIFIKITCMLLIFTSCEKSNDATPGTSPPITGPNGEITLASFTHSSGVQTDFYQLRDSSIFIHAKFPADDNPLIASQREYTQQIHNLVASKKSYGDVYIALVGDKINNAYLHNIRKADLLFKVASEKAGIKKAAAGEVQILMGNNVTAPGLPDSRTESCRGDFYNDGYGYKWFLINFCEFCASSLTGNFISITDKGFFETNRTAQIGATVTGRAAFTDGYVMEAGFDADASLTVTVVDRNILSFTFQVPKRYVSYYSIDGFTEGSFFVTPNTSCSRFHYTFLSH